MHPSSPCRKNKSLRLCLGIHLFHDQPTDTRRNESDEMALPTMSNYPSSHARCHHPSEVVRSDLIATQKHSRNGSGKLLAAVSAWGIVQFKFPRLSTIRKDSREPWKPQFREEPRSYYNIPSPHWVEAHFLSLCISRSRSLKALWCPRRLILSQKCNAVYAECDCAAQFKE
jgi:hypothetical protein